MCLCFPSATSHHCFGLHVGLGLGPVLGLGHNADPEMRNRPWIIFLVTFLGFAFSDFFRGANFSIFWADMKQTGNNGDPEGGNRPWGIFLTTFLGFEFPIFC